ncbi:MAG TPA: PilX N-terminal domain-containing pilus assembly protein [Noviherbaspirillum sp.]|jgi:type IV pilus assembly protein PilX|uniref:pilus assembly PilX family protein n=1 Tax=Noviherbaspirillum sp. TaxID=1926288 RepID=UPI002DDCC90A|nr:PilX N-terminal domain-containing pilus assembly protein [Noviherbaspirillum sp.]HEV2609429.1 PilX N-terminal domain-containing pilus assembly protein [Noviherbaspirillum sp.]
MTNDGMERFHRNIAPRQFGAALIVSLLMLVVVMMLGMSAAQTALQSEKASRNDRDRQVALQAAEAALMDAETDIEGSPDPARSRSRLFAHDRTEGFSPGCGIENPALYLGLCSRAEGGHVPAWTNADLLDPSPAAMTVPYGHFTGQVFQTGAGPMPARPPRYVIELMAYNRAGEDATLDGRNYFYRVTAIGFGMRDTTQVVLQTFYRKDGK